MSTIPRRAAIATAFALGAASLDAQPAPRSFAAAWAPVRAFFHATLAAEGMVGGSMAFFPGDTVLAREHFGFADLATQRRVDDRTIFHWGSVTKTLTAVAIMQQRDRGRLTLDDAILRTVPELRAVHNAFGPMDAITIRQLLSHSAGFRNGTWPWGNGKPWEPFEPTEWSQLVAMMPYTEVLFAPGTQYGYSNPGYVYLGRALEHHAGEAYETYVEKNLFRPLGMASSYFDRTPYHLLPHRSNNYLTVAGTPVAQGLDFDTGITVANGGLNAPVGDIVRYLQFLADAPGLSADARGVLARTSLEEMWRGVVPQRAGSRDSLGLGFFLEERNGLRLVGHTGSQAGFRAFFYIDPTSRAGVVAVFNTAPGGDAGVPPGSPGATPHIDVIIGGLVDRVTKQVFPLYRR
ncbi:MAG: beta-lactamase family protein [Gemmatimonadaceae bacterium]|nr:beta-lactamase family protein [Gemmatimonadaceae bacterium]